MITIKITLTEAEYRRMQKAKISSPYFRDWKLFIFNSCCKGVSLHKTFKDKKDEN